ncbi:hypothetical protein PIB30_040594 [Stylosanthes scabra]|uniref:CS domain-containing protein n=1 Tax=Stylosanthes scabra TaxID=79078 RepID=A0ABU6QEC4_9FABA|nr:hypothetical protein [Stylosanthes scabra]
MVLKTGSDRTVEPVQPSTGHEDGSDYIQPRTASSSEPCDLYEEEEAAAVAAIAQTRRGTTVMASSSAQSCSFCLLHRFSALRLLCTFDAILQKRRRRFAFDIILCHSKKKKKKKRDGGSNDASDDGIFMMTVAAIEKGIKIWVDHDAKVFKQFNYAIDETASLIILCSGNIVCNLRWNCRNEVHDGTATREIELPIGQTVYVEVEMKLPQIDWRKLPGGDETPTKVLVKLSEQIVKELPQRDWRNFHYESTKVPQGVKTARSKQNMRKRMAKSKTEHPKNLGNSLTWCATSAVTSDDRWQTCQQ